MAQATTIVRNARPADAGPICHVHDLSWREAYRGIIPGAELEKIISRRGPQWWKKAIQRGSNVLLLDIGDKVGGYASFGRNRVPAMRHKGELFELYLLPECQGLGFGRKLFMAAQNELYRYGYTRMVVWALLDNDRAIEFYRGLGGRELSNGRETFGSTVLKRTAFEFSLD